MTATALAPAPAILPRPVVSLVIPGEPVAQPRYRHASHRTRSSRTITTSCLPSYHPIWAYRAALQAEAHQAGLTPLNQPLILSAQFYFGSEAADDPEGPRRPDPAHRQAGPQQLAQRTINGVLWVDDSLVCGYGPTGKWFAEQNGQPRTEIQTFCPESFVPRYCQPWA